MREELTAYQHRMLARAQGAHAGEYDQDERPIIQLASAAAIGVDKWEGVPGFEAWPALESWDNVEARIDLCEKHLSPSQLKALNDEVIGRLYLSRAEEGKSEEP